MKEKQLPIISLWISHLKTNVRLDAYNLPTGYLSCSSLYVILSFIKKRGEHTVNVLDVQKSKWNTRIVELNIEGLTQSKVEIIGTRFKNADVPCWTKKCESSLKEYEQIGNEVIITRLIDVLNVERKKRWLNTLEQMDFIYSSRKSWAFWDILRLLNQSKRNTKPRQARLPVYPLIHPISNHPNKAR